MFGDQFIFVAVIAPWLLAVGFGMVLADRKNRNVGLWGVVCLVIPLAFIVILAAPKLPAKLPCPFCKKKVEEGATRCPYCTGSYEQPLSAKT